VGGGNTLKMMRRWRKLGVDQFLERAYHKGAVLSGISAGAICWFVYGHSDSQQFYHPDQGVTTEVIGYRASLP
jgi:dipeptidase E